MLIQKIENHISQEVDINVQDIFIGANCLALTPKERETIENSTFENYYRNHLLEVASDSVIMSKILGTFAGAVLGSLQGGAFVCKTCSLSIIAAGGTLGALNGCISGYLAGKTLGHKKIINAIRNSPEYRKWQIERYEHIIFPALSRYMPRDKWESFQLTCPITCSFMLEPVKATDGHIYEKEAILTHLIYWKQALPESFEGLDQEAIDQLSKNSSPFRAGYIEEYKLKPLPNYYTDIFTQLVDNYNQKVSDQMSILLNLTEKAYDEYIEEEKKIDRFFNMSLRERIQIQTEIFRGLLKSSISQESLEDVCDFLAAAVNFPEKLTLKKEKKVHLSKSLRRY